jgi:hypothetical protein
MVFICSGPSESERTKRIEQQSLILIVSKKPELDLELETGPVITLEQTSASVSVESE